MSCDDSEHSDQPTNSHPGIKGSSTSSSQPPTVKREDPRRFITSDLRSIREWLATLHRTGYVTPLKIQSGPRTKRISNLLVDLFVRWMMVVQNYGSAEEMRTYISTPPSDSPQFHKWTEVIKGCIKMAKEVISNGGPGFTHSLAKELAQPERMDIPIFYTIRSKSSKRSASSTKAVLDDDQDEDKLDSIEDGDDHKSEASAAAGQCDSDDADEAYFEDPPIQGSRKRPQQPLTSSLDANDGASARSSVTPQLKKKRGLRQKDATDVTLFQHICNLEKTLELMKRQIGLG